MRKEKIKSSVELHICSHARENGEDCASKGSKDLTDTLKKWTKEHHKGEIKVVRSGCLGQCEHGIAMACYPERNFLLDVKSNDTEEIKKGLEEALKKVKG